jgi:hypothetical protein
MGRSIQSIKKNAEDLVIVSKGIGLEVHAEKTNYTVMSRNRNAGQNHNTKIVNPLKGWKNSNIWEQP